MLVRVVKLEFPNPRVPAGILGNTATVQSGGWVFTEASPPVGDRVLLVVYGCSGQRRWVEGLVTAPVTALTLDGGRLLLRPGVYEMDMKEDKRGNTLVRFFYPALPTATPQGVVVAVDGRLVEGKAETLISARGHSRTGRHWDEWSLVYIPSLPCTIGWEGWGGMVYERVTAAGIETIPAPLSPEEW